MFVVKFMGGIGNQLLQLNFCNYLKTNYPGTEIKCDITSYRNNNHSSLIDSIHGGFLINKLPFDTIETIKWNNFILIKDKDTIPKLNIKNNYYFEGYWPLNIPFEQTFNFEDVFDINNLSSKNKQIEQEIISHNNNSVAVHIRCGDYNNLFNLGNIATKAYYNNAINYLSKELPNSYFFIFSNDIDWAKNNIEKKNNISYVESNNEKDEAIWDIYLMSKCSNFIISNSSFSLWSQFFCLNKDKIVLTPEYWTNVVSSYSKDGISSFQNFKYMKSIPNIPYQKVSNHKLCFFIKTNKNYLELRRLVTSALNQYSKQLKIYVISNNKKIIKMISSYNIINKNIELINKKRISQKIEESNYYSFINNKFYFIQESIDNLIIELDKNHDSKKYIIPIISMPDGKSIFKSKKQISLPIIYKNFSNNYKSTLLSKPYFCYVNYKKNKLESFNIFIKNCIKYCINAIFFKHHFF